MEDNLKEENLKLEMEKERLLDRIKILEETKENSMTHIHIDDYSENKII